MTSQQTMAMLHAAGVGSPVPMLCARTAAEYERAVELCDAAGLTRTRVRECHHEGRGTWEAVDYLTDNGFVSVHSPSGYEPTPAESLAAATVASDDDRVALTAAGREHLRIMQGGAA